MFNSLIGAVLLAQLLFADNYHTRYDARRALERMPTIYAYPVVKALETTRNPAVNYFAETLLKRR